MDTKQKDAIIVGRFQIHDISLHEGYCKLLRHAFENYKTVIVIIGDSYRKNTFENPLSADIREEAIHSYVEWAGLLDKVRNFVTIRIVDEKSNKVWSDKLDVLIESTSYSKQFDILVGRNSFAPHYEGKYKDNIKELSFDIDGVSSTSIRAAVDHRPDTISEGVNFAKGVIWASKQPFPRVDFTVDIAVLRKAKNGELSVLLGKKPNEKGWRFPGGFVDPSDKSLEDAARRELLEETGVIGNTLHYIDSLNIKDWRYRNSRDSSMTAFFAAILETQAENYGYLVQNMKASDDLSEVDWFSVTDVFNSWNVDMIEPEHRILYELLVDFILDNDLHNEDNN